MNTAERPGWMSDPDRYCNGIVFRNEQGALNVDMWPEDSHGVAIAVAVCLPPGGLPCPVLLQCKEWGIAHREHGVWGGLSMRTQVKIRKSRAGTSERSGCRSNAGNRLVAWDTEAEALVGQRAVKPIYQCDVCGKWHQTRTRRAA